MSDEFEIESAVGGGGAFLRATEWEALGEEKAEIAVRVIRHCGDTPTDQGIIQPVTFDVLILSGSREGEYYAAQTPWKAGIYDTLRRTKEGKVAVGTLAMVKTKRGRTIVALQPADEKLVSRVKAMFKDGRNPFEEAQRKMEEANAADAVTAVSGSEPPF